MRRYYESCWQAAKTDAVGEGHASSRSREPLVDLVFWPRVCHLAKIVALKSVRAKAAPLQAGGHPTFDTSSLSFMLGVSSQDGRRG
jgi:hypothetical protein